MQDNISDLSNALIYTRLYNQANAKSKQEHISDATFSYIESESGCINKSEDTKKCVSVTCCFDKKAFEWLQSKGSNHHITLNKMIAEMMILDEEYESVKSNLNQSNVSICDASSSCC